MGADSTREAIWNAATDLFTRRGFAATSVRDIAATAGADPSLVIRYFGSKESLFLDTMAEALGEQPLLAGPVESLGQEFIRYLLDAEDRVRGVFIALLRASDAGGVGSRLREVHETTFVMPLRSRLDGPDAELRARLAASLVGGLLYGLWVVGDDHLAAADPEEIVARYGALLQELITPDA